MALDRIINKHMSAIAENYGVNSFNRTNESGRKYNRVIQSEVVAMASDATAVARAENARLRLKVKSSYLVASGEANTAAAVNQNAKENIFKTAARHVKNFIDAIIEAIANFFRGFAVQEKRWKKISVKFKEHIDKASGEGLKKDIKFTHITSVAAIADDLKNNTAQIDKLLRYALGGVSGAKNIQFDKAPEIKKYDKNANTKEMSIKSVSELKSYGGQVLAIGDRALSDVEKLRSVKKALLDYKKIKGRNEYDKKDKVAKAQHDENEGKLRDLLKAINQCIAQFQIVFGILNKEAGKMLRAIGVTPDANGGGNGGNGGGGGGNGGAAAKKKGLFGKKKK